uniref:Uncharacterized protein n=1 Tax=Cucumis melo TaxID=3656 RepID=A0A9I9EG26_CUCME
MEGKRDVNNMKREKSVHVGKAHFVWEFCEDMSKVRVRREQGRDEDFPSLYDFRLMSDYISDSRVLGQHHGLLHPTIINGLNLTQIGEEQEFVIRDGSILLEDM